jgi:hypothetical protein
MSTMTIHEVRLSPTRVSRPVARRVERPSTVRLTRRGRVTVLLLGLALALAGGIFLGAGAAAATGEDDVRGMVDRIASLNALESGMVLAGQRLRVPTD